MESLTTGPELENSQGQEETSTPLPRALVDGVPFFKSYLAALQGAL